MKSFKEIEQLEKIAKEVLTEAKKQGASSAEAVTDTEDGFSITVRLGQVENIEYHKEKHCGITVYFGKRKGTVNTSDTRSESLKAAVTAACRIASFTEEDDCAGLADAELMASEKPDLDLHYPWEITPDKAIELALKCEHEARGLDAQIKNSEGVSVATHQSFCVYGNSHGFIGSIPSTRHSMDCVLIAEQKSHMERDYDYTVARDATELKNYKELAKSAVKKTVSRLGAQKITTRKVPIIFSAELARSLFGSFISAISGGNLYRKASFLIDHLEQQIFPKNINICERPYLLKGLGSSAFDSEGVAVQNKDFITDGILKSYVLGSYSARKLKMQTTANAGGVHNLIVKPGELDLQGLLKKMNKGVLVTELIGQGVNLVTGDYSRGAFGFWVENGKIQYPVSEITIAGNLKDMFMNIAAVGCDIDKRGNIQTGSVLLEEMMVAGS